MIKLIQICYLIDLTLNAHTIEEILLEFVSTMEEFSM